MKDEEGGVVGEGEGDCVRVDALLQNVIRRRGETPEGRIRRNCTDSSFSRVENLPR